MTSEVDLLTSAASDPPGLRITSLVEHIAERIDGIDPSESLTATLMAGGRSNVTYLLAQGSRAWVLRRPPLGNVLPSAHDMGREHRVLAGLTRAGYPVPKPLLLCTDPNVIGAPFMMMEFVPGRVIADSTDSRRLSPVETAAISGVLVDSLVSLHAIDPASCGLEDLGRPHGFVARQIDRWGGQWALTKTRELPAIDLLLEWLQRQVGTLPPDLPSGIIHGDFRLDNLIFEAGRSEVNAVLDWEMSTLGDPVADLAVTLVYWSEAADTLRLAIPVADLVTVQPGFWSRQEIASRYAERTGSDLEHLDICLALACLKLAVIMESIHLRTLQGRQLGTAAGETGSMANAASALARIGLEVTRGHGLRALSM